MEIKIEAQELNELSLREVMDRMQWMRDLGFEVWIEGRGNGTFNLKFEKDGVKIKEEVE